MLNISRLREYFPDKNDRELKDILDTLQENFSWELANFLWPDRYKEDILGLCGTYGFTLCLAKVKHRNLAREKYEYYISLSPAQLQEQLKRCEAKEQFEECEIIQAILTA